MKVTHIALFVAILVLNNLVLLWISGYFSGPSDRQPLVSTTRAINPEIAREPESNSNSQSTEKVSVLELRPSVTEISRTVAVDGQSLFNQEQKAVYDAVIQYVTSPEYGVILDNLQLASAERYDSIHNDLNRLDALDLYERVTSSEDLYEKRIALNLLMRGQLDDLSNLELETLYREYATDGHTKASLLTHMMDRNAPGALSLAKELVSGELADNPYSYSMEIFESLYQRDTEFIESMITRLDLSKRRLNASLVNYALREPHLRNHFIETHLDDILEQGSNEILKLASHRLQTKLNRSQEQTLQSMMGSDNRYRRAFAISMASNVNDREQLRAYFQALERPADQRRFLTTLLSHKELKDPRSFVQQLASTSDDLGVQAILETQAK